MNRFRSLRAAAAAALVLAPLALTAPTLAAQRAPGAVWHEVVRGDDGTVVAVDSASVSHTEGSSFIVRTAVLFPQPIRLDGAPVDRKIDVEELDCDSIRTRGVESQFLSDAAVVQRVPLSRMWERVAENRRPLFDARCGYLRGSFGVPVPATRPVDEVDEMPNLANPSEVLAELSRAYPRELRAAGVTGTVAVRMRVLENGRVDEPTITIVAASYPGFAEGAVQAVRRMRFHPARADRQRVAMWVVLPVTFCLPESSNPLADPGMNPRQPAPGAEPPPWRRP